MALLATPLSKVDLAFAPTELEAFRLQTMDMLRPIVRGGMPDMKYLAPLLRVKFPTAVWYIVFWEWQGQTQLILLTPAQVTLHLDLRGWFHKSSFDANVFILMILLASEKNRDFDILAAAKLI